MLYVEIPGEKLVLKLWDTIADKGIGSLLKPWPCRYRDTRLDF